MQQTFQPVVFGVIHDKGKFLFTLRDDSTSDDDNGEFHNMWQFPGGGVDFGESLENAVVRECKEEVGLNISVEYVIPCVQTAIRGSWQGVFIPYMCHATNKNQDVVLNEEASTFGWFTLEEVKSMTLIPINLRIIEQIKNTKL